jgi:hypothetical protein
LWHLAACSCSGGTSTLGQTEECEKIVSSFVTQHAAAFDRSNRPPRSLSGEQECTQTSHGVRQLSRSQCIDLNKPSQFVLAAVIIAHLGGTIGLIRHNSHSFRQEPKPFVGVSSPE